MADTVPSPTTTREAVLAVAQQMLADGLVEGTSGNISGRLPDGLVCLSPSSVPYDTMTLDDLVVVDLDALTDALASGHLGGAGLDHFEGEHIATDHPLVGMTNVVLTPHIGGATYDTETNHTTLMATGLAALLRGERPSNLANPEVLSHG